MSSAIGSFVPRCWAIVNASEPVRTGAYSQQLIQLNESASCFPATWIQYLCPWLAEKITPPPTVLVRALAQRRAVDDRDDRNLRRGQPRASFRRPRHGRRHGAVERAALAFGEVRCVLRLAGEPSLTRPC